MGTTEIVIIVIIVAIWGLSIRKFIKKFERIRTTHYREIPYNFRFQQSNLNQLRIVKEEEQIFPIEPIKVERSRSIISRDVKPLSFDLAKAGVESKRSFNETFKNHHKNPCDRPNRPETNMRFFDVDSHFKFDPMPSSTLLLDMDTNPVRIKKSAQVKSNQDLNSAVQEHLSTELNDTSLIQAIVRRSLLDLHRKSMINISNQQSFRSTSGNIPTAASIKYVESPL
jgi:hypothetical protein